MDLSYLFAVMFQTVTTTQTLYNNCFANVCDLTARIYVESCQGLEVVQYSPIHFFYMPKLKCDPAPPNGGYWVSVELVQR